MRNDKRECNNYVNTQYARTFVIITRSRSLSFSFFLFLSTILCTTFSVARVKSEGGEGAGEKIIEGGNIYTYIHIYICTRGIRTRWQVRRVARCGASERKTGGQRNGDIRETRRHFIDSPRDDATQCSPCRVRPAGRSTGVFTDEDRVSRDRTSMQRRRDRHGTRR